MSENNNIQKEIHNGTDTELSVSYLLNQIAKIADSSEFINEVLSELKQMPADAAGYAKAQTLEAAIQSREKTNQQLLRMYEKMYDDIKPPKKDGKEKLLDLLEKIVNDPQVGMDEKDSMLSTITNLYAMED